MKHYTVNWSDRARKQLRKLDKSIAEILLRWVHKNLDNCEDPRLHGKALVGDKSGQWRYRVGDYRLLAEIQDDKVIILILSVGHRREVYD